MQNVQEHPELDLQRWMAEVSFSDKGEVFLAASHIKDT